MKWIWIILVVLVLSLSWLAYADDKKEPPKEEKEALKKEKEASKNEKKELKTATEKFSYAYGMQASAYLKNVSEEIDLAVFFQGVEDTLKGKELLLTPEQAEEIRNEFFKKKRAEQARKRQELAEKNKKEGGVFLEENKKKESVVTTATGLQYMVLSRGNGPKPKVTDVVNVHYRGTLIDGTEFDSSYKRNQPATFALKGVIRGWTEALQLMSVGSKYRLFIPSDLAYGERGSGPLIGPNATLIFEIELLEIKK